MTATAPGRNVRIAVAAALAAAAIAAVLLMSGVFGRDGDAVAARPAGPAMIPAMAPADADTFVMAPYSPQWWAKVAAMAPAETRLLESDPVPEGFALDRIGYSRSPDHEKRDVLRTGPLRLFYLEAPDPEEAGRIAEWLRDSPGSESRRVHVVDRVVIVAPTWVASYSTPQGTIDSVPGFRASDAPGKGTYWMNVDQEVASLASGADEDARKAAMALVRNGLGFAEGTTWLGTSEAGESWSGRFAAGGVKPGKINFDTVRATVASTDDVLAEGEDGNVRYQVISSSVAQALNVARITAEGQSGALGTGTSEEFPKVTAPVVSATTDVAGWDAALSGIYGPLENIATRNISANESEMVVSFGYATQ